MDDKTPFFTVTETAHNFTMEDCEFHGDKPIMKTAATNTRIIRTKHFVQQAKEHCVITLIATVVAAVLAGLIFRYVFQI